MDILTFQAEIAIAKIENSRLLTGEILRLGIAIGKGKKIKSVVEGKNRIRSVKVVMDDATAYHFC